MLAAAAIGFAPAIVLMLITLQNYTYPRQENPYFSDPTFFALFTLGIFIGIILYVVSIMFGIYYLILGFLLEESVKLLILNLKRFQRKDRHAVLWFRPRCWNRFSSCLWWHISVVDQYWFHSGYRDIDSILDTTYIAQYLSWDNDRNGSCERNPLAVLWSGGRGPSCVHIADDTVRARSLLWERSHNLCAVRICSDIRCSVLLVCPLPPSTAICQRGYIQDEAEESAQGKGIIYSTKVE